MVSLREGFAPRARLPASLRPQRYLEASLQRVLEAQLMAQALQQASRCQVLSPSREEAAQEHQPSSPSTIQFHVFL